MFRNSTYFNLNLYPMQKLGISFEEHVSPRYKIISGVWLTSIFVAFIVVETLELFWSLGNTDRLSAVLSYYGTDVIGIFVMVPAFVVWCYTNVVLFVSIIYLVQWYKSRMYSINHIKAKEVLVN